MQPWTRVSRHLLGRKIWTGNSTNEVWIDWVITTPTSDPCSINSTSLPASFQYIAKRTPALIMEAIPGVDTRGLEIVMRLASLMFICGKYSMPTNCLWCRKEMGSSACINKRNLSSRVLRETPFLRRWQQRRDWGYMELYPWLEWGTEQFWVAAYQKTKPAFPLKNRKRQQAWN